MPAITRINLWFSLRTLRNAFSSDVNSVHTRVGGCTRGAWKNLNFCKADAKKMKKKWKNQEWESRKEGRGSCPFGLSAFLPVLNWGRYLKRIFVRFGLSNIHKLLLRLLLYSWHLEDRHIIIFIIDWNETISKSDSKYGFFKEENFLLLWSGSRKLLLWTGTYFSRFYFNRITTSTIVYDYMECFFINIIKQYLLVPYFNKLTFFLRKCRDIRWNLTECAWHITYYCTMAYIKKWRYCFFP
jgi:hypothetical protein